MVGNAVTVSASLPIDGALRTGVLPNGLTYYVRRNATPSNSVSMALIVKAGALNEDDNQRGIAHFIEHICFDGTIHFPNSSLDRYLQSVGLKPGADYNASTFITHTRFHINNIPSQRTSTIDSCLLVLSDWAGGLTFKRKAIEKERRIIREEWRASVGARTRMYSACLPEIYGGSRYGYRLPIGLMSVVDTLSSAGLNPFYDRWYVPSNQCVCVIGDVDVDHTVAELVRLFKKTSIPSNMMPQSELLIPDNAKPIITISSDKEQNNLSFLLSRKIEPFRPSERNSEDFLRHEYACSMMGYMLSARMAEINTHSSSPFFRVESDYTDFMLTKAKMSIRTSFLCAADSWEESFVTAYREICRVRKFGFTSSELSRIKSDYEVMFRSRLKESQGKHSLDWLNDCIDNYLYGDPVMDAEDDARICLSLLSNITPEYVDSLASSVFADSCWVFSAFCPLLDDSLMPTKVRIEELVSRVESEDILPYVDINMADSLFAVSPDAGEMISYSDGPFGSKVAMLSNGARVVLAPTEYKNDEIRMVSFRPKGLNSFAAVDASNTRIMHGMVSGVGFGGLSNVELSRILSGHQVAAQVYANEYRSGISGHSTVADFETLLRLVNLKLTSPNSDPKLLRTYVDQLSVRLLESKPSAGQCFADSVGYALYGRERPRGELSVEELADVTPSRVIDIYRSLYSDVSGSTFIFTGNIDSLTHLPLILKYIGGIVPQSCDSQLVCSGQYVLPGERSIRFSFPMREPTVVTEIDYSVRMPFGFHESVVCDVLSQVAERMLTRRLRETQGGTYDVMVDCSMSQQRQSEILFSVYFKSSVERHRSLLKSVTETLTSLSVDGPRNDDFESVREFMVRYESEHSKSNTALLDAIDTYYWCGMDKEISSEDELRSMKSAELSSIMSLLLNSGNKVEVVMRSR